jgi:hypothetical protein
LSRCGAKNDVLKPLPAIWLATAEASFTNFLGRGDVEK